MTELDSIFETATKAASEARTKALVRWEVRERALQKNIDLIADTVHQYIADNASRGVSGVTIDPDTPFGYSFRKCDCGREAVHNADRVRFERALSKHKTSKTKYTVEEAGGCASCDQVFRIKVERRCVCDIQ